MSTNTIAAVGVEQFLESISGDYVKAYNDILAEEQTRAVAQRAPSNAETRKKAYQKAVRELDRKTLASMNKTVRGFLPLAKANSAITVQTGVLEESEAMDLMIEVLEVKRLQEIAKSRYEEIRKRVFNSITESFAQQGEVNPEVIAGFIELPKMGLKFAREGGGFKDPELDEDALAALVGEDVWEQVTTVEIIPAQEVRTFDAELFLQAARKKPALLEELRKALKVGDPAPQRFAQRALEETKE